jgi:hypothetical protein
LVWDLDVVAEDLVVAHLHILDAGLLLGAGLQVGQHVRSVVHHVAQPVHLFAVPLPDELALPHRERGLVHQGTLEKLPQFGQIIQLFSQRLEQSGGAGLQKLTDAGQFTQACGQGGEVPASGGAVHHPANEPLQVGDLPQGEGQLLPGDDVLHQVAHRLLPPGDLYGGEEGPLHPAPDEAVAHGGAGFIHDPQEGAFLLFAPQGFSELQSLPGGEVQLHKLARSVVGEGGDMTQIGFLGVIEVAEQPARSLDSSGVPGRQGLQPGGKLLVYHLPGVVQGKALLFPVLAHAIQAVLQKVGEARQRPGPLREHRLGGVEAAQLVFQVVPGLRSGREGSGKHLAGGDIAQAQAYP